MLAPNIRTIAKCHRLPYLSGTPAIRMPSGTRLLPERKVGSSLVAMPRMRPPMAVDRRINRSAKLVALPADFIPRFEPAQEPVDLLNTWGL
jgi:hypothetical protein